ncbi:WD40 repeat domain-containing protein [Micromonospora sp. NPDC005298]|uniref:WD40 repeat domain-containing protein n=1 Tax=Micromonospora sp. NPDC005298 TaxID=3156873 RepID=UPI00339EC27C
MDRFERMVALLRSGQTARADQLRAEEPAALLPRWTAGEPLSPALRQVHQLGSSIKAVRLDDRYAWAMADGSIYRMPIAGGESHRVRLEGRHESYYPEAVFDDETVVAVEDERLLVWDVATGKLLLATDPDGIPLRAGPLRSLAVGAGVAVTGTEGGYLLKWDLADGRLLSRTAAHSGYVFQVAISADGAPLVLSLGGEDDHTMTLCFHDLDGLRRTGEVAMAEPTTCGGWTVLDGQRRAVTVGGDGLLTVWNDTTVAPVAQFPTTTDPRGAPVFLAGGAWAVLGERRALRIMDLRDGTLRGTIRSDFTQPVHQVAVRGSFLFVAQGGSTEGRTNLFELADPLAQDDPERPYFDEAVLAMINGRPVVVAVDQSGAFAVVDAADGRDLGGPAGERHITYRAADWSPLLGRVTLEGRDLVVALSRLKPATVDLATGEAHTVPESPLTPAVLHAVVARDGLIAAIDRGGALAVWDAATLALRASLQLDLRETTSIALGDLHGRTVVLTGTDGGGFRWFDSADLTELTPPGRFAERTGRTAPESWNWPGPAAVSRLHVLGSVVISAVSGTVTCADITTGESTGPALVHPGAVGAMLPTVLDGVPVVATGCADRVLRVWEIETGRTIWSVALPGQVRRIVSVTANQVIVLTEGHLIAVGPLTVTPSSAVDGLVVR